MNVLLIVFCASAAISSSLLDILFVWAAIDRSILLSTEKP